MKKFFTEFKTFISRGNVMDLAVATIIGAAFTAIVTALSNGILKPLINTAIYYIIPGEGLESMYSFLVKKYELDEAGALVVDAETGKNVVDLAKSIYIDWGAFISAIINFILVAFVLFLIIKAFNAAKSGAETAKNEEKRIQAKQAKGLKLTSKEAAFLAEQQTKAQAEAEAAAEAQKAQEEYAKAHPSQEELLTQIRDLLANK